MPAMLLRCTAFLSIGCLAACQAPGGQNVAPTQATQTSSQRSSARKATPNLYVADASAITVYAAGGTTVLRTIAPVTPTALAIDPAGNLYVANVPSGAAGVVSVYAARTTTPLRTISDVQQPHALAIDSSGSLCVADYYGGVRIYSPESTRLVRALKVFFPVSLAFDASQDLFVGEIPGPYGGGQAAKVQMYDAGATTAARTITNGIGAPAALAFDASGNLYVANQNKNSVTVYAPDSRAPLRTIVQGIHAPRALVFDRAGNLYVANSGSNSVSVYARASTSVLRNIRDGVRGPAALALDAGGNLYVANAGSVSVYAAGTSSLLRTIRQGVRAPLALAFGP
jgi:sugar lactone lactonase YvrE